MKQSLIIIYLCLTTLFSFSQTTDSAIIARIQSEASMTQLPTLAHELTDEIGPRLVGTPQMQKAHDWAVAKYKSWGISAKNENWGTWRGWERGISHIDMLTPRVQTLEGRQLAWSPATGPKAVVAEAIILHLAEDSIAFQKWLPSVKGKFVLVSMNQPTGRPDYNWEEFATKTSFEKMKADRILLTDAWAKRIKNTGLTAKALALALEKAGAVGLVACNWSRAFGTNKIFSANTTKVPTVDISLEDYGMLYRLIESGNKPTIAVRTESKELGRVPASNTVAEIKGVEKPNEFVMLSAHFDSWDGATGATDNGTGTIVMMEAMRILKKVYPNPKRTIIAGHWGSEEQGLNGSRAFVEDNPNIVNHLQALFNQDNGTGRVVNISGQGFLHAYDFITRWLAKVPDSIKNQIETKFPGTPGGGGSDFASFVAAGAPGFSLSSNSWSYGNYTWHTNRDTYDKIVFDDVQNNAILVAILVYMACEDPQKTSREKAVLPSNNRTGVPGKWPEIKKANREGGKE
ncbi:MAG: M20/M25/M40 family metallo-hydrolase [Ferruginibacter sp.]